MKKDRLILTLMVLAGVSVLAYSAIQWSSEQWSSENQSSNRPSVDTRPMGTLEDVLAFKDRDDFNVLFILVDTLRADHLNAYGYERSTSPKIAELAKSGIRFANHVSQSSWTKCSMASMWTSLYPPRTGVLRSGHALPDGARMPAETFREAGFRTAGIWRNGWIAPNFGFGQGFEIYTQPRPSKLEQASAVENPHVTLAGTDGNLINSAFSFFSAYGDKRWFLYLHMMDVHQYVSSEEEAIFGTRFLDLYDNAILWTDNLIGHLLDELDARGLREKTLIVFASDHGEAFGEHDGEGHARNVYGEVTTTPLILNFPFRLEPGIVVESQSENVDLWPTILELAGMEPQEDPDGRSLVPDIVAASRGESDSSGDDLAYAVIDQTWGRDGIDPQPQVAVNQGSWRLLYSTAEPSLPLLFDKQLDPGEQRNVAKQNPDLTEDLVLTAQEHLDSRPAPWGDTPNIEIDDLQVNQLRALGYGIH